MYFFAHSVSMFLTGVRSENARMLLNTNIPGNLCNAKIFGYVYEGISMLTIEYIEEVKDPAEYLVAEEAMVVNDIDEEDPQPEYDEMEMIFVASVMHKMEMSHKTSL